MRCGSMRYQVPTMLLVVPPTTLQPSSRSAEASFLLQQGHTASGAAAASRSRCLCACACACACPLPESTVSVAYDTHDAEDTEAAVAAVTAVTVVAILSPFLTAATVEAGEGSCTAVFARGFLLA